MRLFSLILLGILPLSLTGCITAKPPTLPDMRVERPVESLYTTALQDLDTILQVYYPPDARMVYYYVKPINDATGLSGTGEIPMNITTMVRDAVSQISYKVRYVEQYDLSDQVHLQVEQMLKNTSKIRTEGYQHLRPNADYTIAGSISMFDRNLQSSSDEARAMAAVGGGDYQAQLDASAKSSANFSRLGVSFNVFLENGVSVPGRFGGEMDVWLAKNSRDIGFSIRGVGLGFGAEATAMHGRHMALRMLTEFSVVQIIGNTLNVPYWRVGRGRTIFQEDAHVINAWRSEFQSYMSQPERLIAYMQAQCIANGDNSVHVTGVLDETTRAAFERFARQYHVGSGALSFALYKALELNRKLDPGVASRAWAAYNAYKNGGALPAAPAVSVPPAPVLEAAPVPVPEATPAPETRAPRAVQPARPAAPSPRRSSNYEDVLNDLI